LWTRNAEISVLAACRELGVAFVAFSPLGRGFLAGSLRSVEGLDAKDIRRAMPRFAAPHFERNLRLYDAYAAIAREATCTPAQLALAWLLARGEHIVPIPGTTRPEHLEENVAAVQLALPAGTLARVDALINQQSVSGARYNDATQAEIDTETF
jgi:aryl-alcohol dehydrogenase-like predicted oxidoreductase